MERLKRELEACERQARERGAWQSSNEGVKERTHFADTIWGFELAGGKQYNTPLRVTQVVPGGRASHAGIQPGDLVSSINGLDAVQLTLQEAHAIVLASGLELKLVVAAPDVDETTRTVWQDEWDDEVAEKKSKSVSKNRGEYKSILGCNPKVEEWDEAWGVALSRGRSAPVYRDSNCHLVPSKRQSWYQQKICPAKEPVIPQ